MRGAIPLTGVDLNEMSFESNPVTVRMADFARRRHGIVSLDELRAAGVPRTTVTAWVDSGRLHRLYPGVYSIVPPSMLNREGNWFAAVKACGAEAFLSHAPSLQLQGVLDRRERLAHHVSVRHRRSTNPNGIVVHRPTNLPPLDTLTLDAIPTTSVTRAIWDSATSLPPRPIRKAFEKASRLNRLDRPRLVALADAHPNHKGSGHLRLLLADRPQPAAEVRSWLEELIWDLCSEHRLPLPAVNVPLLDYEVDFLWREERLVVEADGGDHLERTQRDRDNLRDFALQRAGYLVRRYSARDLTRPLEVVAEIGESLRERSTLR